MKTENNKRREIHKRFKVMVSLIKSYSLILIISVGMMTYGQNTITFSFDLPDNTTFIETMRSTKEFGWTDSPKVEAQIIEIKSQFKIYSTSIGYSVEKRPTEMPSKTSDDFSGTLQSILASLVIIYDLDPTGKLLRVRGIEEGMNKMKNTLPFSTEEWDLVLSMIPMITGGDSIEQLYINEWNNRGMLGFLVGQTVEVNRLYTNQVQLPVPDGNSIRATCEMKLNGLRNCKEGRCAEFEATYRSDDSVVGEQLSKMLNNMVLSAASAAEFSQEQINEFNNFMLFDFSNPIIEIKSKRLIDPDTGLIYSETEIKTIGLRMNFEGEESKDFKYFEKKEYSYSYSN